MEVIMDRTIMQCICVRTDFFEKYYSVPGNVQAEVDDFISKMHSIGEQSKDAQDFETKFAENGLQNVLNSLLSRCTPKPYKMTKEEKAVAKETAKKIFEEDRSRILKEGVEEAIDYSSVMAEEELMALKRKAMIEAGVYDEYTRASNAIDMIKDPKGFFKGLFRMNK